MEKTGKCFEYKVLLQNVLVFLSRKVYDLNSSIMFSINTDFKIPTSAAENYVVHPVCVVLHGLEVRVLRILHIPYPERLCKRYLLFMTCDQPLSPDDAVSPRAVQPLEVVIVLETVYPRPVAALTLVPNHKTHLKFKKI